MQPHPSDIRGSSHGCCRKTAAGTPFALVCWRRKSFDFWLKYHSIWKTEVCLLGDYPVLLENIIGFGEPYCLFEAKEVIRSVGAASGVLNPLTYMYIYVRI